MNTENKQTKALVTVFEDMEAAVKAVDALHQAGYGEDKLELVTHHLHSESPEVETPKIHETTASSLISSAEYGGAFGAGTGALAGLLAAIATPFPGALIGGMMIMGGVTGAIMGGIAGVDHAESDDSVNLPTVDEYEELLRNGNKLIVVHGTHDEVLRAKDAISHLPTIHHHLHALHGHEFHEHPSSESTD